MKLRPWSSILLVIVSILLNSCSTILHDVAPEEMTAKEKAYIEKVKPYLRDTSIKYTYEFDRHDRLGYIDLSEDTNSIYDVHYSIAFRKNDELKNVTYTNERAYSDEKIFTKQGELRYESEDSIIEKKGVWQYERKRDLGYHQNNGRTVLVSQAEYYKDHHYCFVTYHDDGSKKQVQTWHKQKLDGSEDYFYKNGSLKTHMVWKEDRLISVKEYDQRGNDVQETNVENGNGRWLRCEEDAGFCCDCVVKDGKLINCRKS